MEAGDREGGRGRGRRGRRGRRPRRRRREPNLRRAEETFSGEEPQEQAEGQIFGGEELLEGGPAAEEEGLDLFDEDRPRPVEPPPRRRGGETARRVAVAIPWILFAVAITVAGGIVFAVAMVGLGWVGLREYFVMTAKLRPIQVAAMLALPAMIAAAHFGDSFQIVWCSPPPSRSSSPSGRTAATATGSPSPWA